MTHQGAAPDNGRRRLQQFEFAHYIAFVLCAQYAQQVSVRLSAAARALSSKPTVASLLQCARCTGVIDRLLTGAQRQRQTSARAVPRCWRTYTDLRTHLPLGEK